METPDLFAQLKLLLQLDAHNIPLAETSEYSHKNMCKEQLGHFNDSRIQPRSAPLAKLGRIA
jgi:hypothetical protein